MNGKYSKEELERAFPFQQHGVEFTDLSSDGINFVGTCPFSNKAGKFFVNKESGMWDSKNTGRQGNLYTFLKEWYVYCLANTKNVDLVELAKSRDIPTAAFSGDVAWNPLTNAYMIPSFNHEGKLNQLSMWRPGEIVRRTADTKISLKNCHLMSGNDLPVYLFEGEWDMYAAQFLFKTIGHAGVCLSLPGATNLNKDWIPLFKGKRVYCCFDNDDAGRRGEDKAAKFLRGTVLDIQFVQWAETLPDKYDIRDFILQGVEKKFLTATRARLIKIKDELHSLFQEHTTAERDAPISIAPPRKDITIPTRQEIEAAFSKYLKLSSYEALAVMFGVCFANKIPTGEPIWQFIVAPPGAGKTAMVSPLSKSPFCETLSTLTPASLVSGFKTIDGAESSILPALNNRMLIIKDFTTILNAHPNMREEIFGYLRDIYDGKIEKVFGNGIKRKYESRFGVIACVTTAIDGFGAVQSALGERFIKYRLDRHMTDESERLMVLMAMRGITQENQMKEELGEIGFRFLEKEIPTKLPNFQNEEDEMTVADLAMLTARMRASSSREKFTNEQLTMPGHEMGTRLGRQFFKLAMGLAIYFDHENIGEQEIQIIRQIAADTCPDRVEFITRLLYTSAPPEGVDMKWLSERTNLSLSTIQRMTEDLQSLKILTRAVSRGGPFSAGTWCLHPEIRKLIESSSIYEKPQILKPEPESRQILKVKKL